MLFATAYISKTGGREQNQDFCAFKEVGTSAIWVVADGLGGHRGGEVASETTVAAILEAWQPEKSVGAQATYELVISAQSAIISQQDADPKLASMRTTLVLLQASADLVLWGHVGDSRLYLFSSGAVAFQTKDHSVPQAMVDAGEITSEDIRVHPDRNRILKAVGNPDGVNPTILEAPRQIKQGDAFLLCTDGFWEYVTEIEMAVDLAKSATPEAWLKKMELRLIEKVETGNDNYTAMAVFVS